MDIIRRDTGTARRGSSCAWSVSVGITRPAKRTYFGCVYKLQKRTLVISLNPSFFFDIADYIRVSNHRGKNSDEDRVSDQDEGHDEYQGQGYFFNDFDPIDVVAAVVTPNRKKRKVCDI